MFLTGEQKKITISCGNTRFSFLDNGETFRLMHNQTMINQVSGTILDGALSNIYVRVFTANKPTTFPLIHPNTISNLIHTDNSLTWNGSTPYFNYKLVLTLTNEYTWFWSLHLESDASYECDVIYTQDLSLSDLEATLTNELYMSQYIDHKIFDTSNGYVTCSRQNQGKQHAYLQQGALNIPVVAYCTDALQFYGLDYKRTQEPIAFTHGLPSENYQFEQTLIGLQTEKFLLSSSKEIGFYSYFQPDHAKSVDTLEFQTDIADAFNSLSITGEPQQYLPIKISNSIAERFVSAPFNDSEINKFFPKKTLCEYNDDNELLSFFKSTHEHVILQEKENIVERPHGHIITSGIDEEKLKTELITSTSYMYGIFNAQITCGNTSFNKLISTPRSLLNVFSNSGQRIFVKLNGKYQLLTMPAAYELGFNYAKWYYKIDTDCLIITSFTSCDTPTITLDIKSLNGINYEYHITNQLVLGSNEFENGIVYSQKDNTLTLMPEANTLMSDIYSDLKYTLTLNGTDFTVGSDANFYEDNNTRCDTLLTFSTSAASELSLTITGHFTRELAAIENASFITEHSKFIQLYKRLTCHFNLQAKNPRMDIDKLNTIFQWYTHNALVHYAVPHGLEQPGGAAWGTRDVCQGPMEFFLMTQHYTLAKAILCEIFSHQFLETGEWPQWFMFDRYNMQQDDCHGDVVFWPLKALGDYVRITGDTSIFTELLPYRHFQSGKVTEVTSMLDHVKKALASIESRFLYGTALISYAGGDWDDTLQPASKELKEQLVSSWTEALAFQSLKQLSEVTETIDGPFSLHLKQLSTEIHKTFQESLIKDNVIAGFAFFANENTLEYMLHPDDNKTGIHYRLLPMTRSIISELVDQNQADHNVSLIAEHLTFPDGVRLMDAPATYTGGNSVFFQRAEQAANVGREIGLNYIHAHIRFIEAMAKYGDTNTAWQALETINPILINKSVSNALPRQSNAYFSSSDGNFMDRYDFQDNFQTLKTQTTSVKGGWRIYSSGPGIYLNQLVSNVLGFRRTSESIIIDPILPNDLETLNFSFAYEKHPLKITFTFTDESSSNEIKAISLNGKPLPFHAGSNPYRIGGAVIDKLVFEQALSLQPLAELIVYL
ncbi:MAG: GH36-type glycosyl hydrolase domain-containing protein [Culicoidibacterales bacterium]